MALVASHKIPLITERTHYRPMNDIKQCKWTIILKDFTSCSLLWWIFMVLRAREVKLQPGTSQWNAGSLLWVSRCLRKSIIFLHLANTKSSVEVLRKKQCNARVFSLNWFGIFAASEDVKPVFAVVTAVWLLVTVAELYVVAQCRRRWTCHVTQRAFVVAHCTIKKKTNQETRLSHLIILQSCLLSKGLPHSLGHQSVLHYLLVKNRHRKSPIF